MAWFPLALILGTISLCLKLNIVLWCGTEVLSKAAFGTSARMGRYTLGIPRLQKDSWAIINFEGGRKIQAKFLN
jgi:hypothetical protein